MQIGFIGLGKMGSRMAKKLLNEGHDVVVWNRSADAISNFKYSTFAKASADKQNLKIADSTEGLIASLDKPRTVWVMVPAGDATEEITSRLKNLLERNDLIIDGGNSHFADSDKRYEQFRTLGINFFGIGVSGGIHGAENGYSLMVGGSSEGYEKLKPVLDSLAKPNGGHEYFGEGGAGHFVKMIHNGIEYGMMQSLGEGFEVLEKSKYNLDLVKVSSLWQKGTIVSGFLLDRAKDALERDPTLSGLTGKIDSSGEAEWTVETAQEEGVSVEIIERSLEYRKRSKTDPKIQNSFTARLVAALRREFGGHEVKKS